MAEKIIRIVNIAFRTRKFVCILKCQSFQTLHSTSSWGCRNYNHDHIVAKFWSLLNCYWLYIVSIWQMSPFTPKFPFVSQLPIWVFRHVNADETKQSILRKCWRPNTPCALDFTSPLFTPKIQCFKKIVCCVWVKINNKCQYVTTARLFKYSVEVTSALEESIDKTSLTKQEEFQSILGLAWITVPGSTAKKVKIDNIWSLHSTCSTTILLLLHEKQDYWARPSKTLETCD